MQLLTGLTILSLTLLSIVTVDPHPGNQMNMSHTTNIAQHPLFRKSEKIGYNIAVVRLTGRKASQPQIKLPKHPPSTKATGYVSDCKRKPKAVTLFNKKKCDSEVGGGLPADMICAYMYTQKKPCPPIIGSGLVQGKTLIGILSMVYKGKGKKVLIFTNVNSHKGWVHDIVDGFSKEDKIRPDHSFTRQGEDLPDDDTKPAEDDSKDFSDADLITEYQADIIKIGEPTEDDLDPDGDDVPEPTPEEARFSPAPGAMEDDDPDESTEERIRKEQCIECISEIFGAQTDSENDRSERDEASAYMVRARKLARDVDVLEEYYNSGLAYQDDPNQASAQQYVDMGGYSPMSAAEASKQRKIWEILQKNDLTVFADDPELVKGILELEKVTHYRETSLRRKRLQAVKKYLLKTFNPHKKKLALKKERRKIARLDRDDDSDDDENIKVDKKTWNMLKRLDLTVFADDDKLVEAIKQMEALAAKITKSQ